MHDFDDAPNQMSIKVAEAWRNVRVLEARGRRSRNAIVMAGAVLDRDVPALHMRPLISADEIDAERKAMQFRW